MSWLCCKRKRPADDVSTIEKRNFRTQRVSFLEPNEDRDENQFTIQNLKSSKKTISSRKSESNPTSELNSVKEREIIKEKVRDLERLEKEIGEDSILKSERLKVAQPQIKTKIQKSKGSLEIPRDSAVLESEYQRNLLHLLDDKPAPGSGFSFSQSKVRNVLSNQSENPKDNPEGESLLKSGNKNIAPHQANHSALLISEPSKNNTDNTEQIKPKGDSNFKSSVVETFSNMKKIILLGDFQKPLGGSSTSSSLDHYIGIVEAGDKFLAKIEVEGDCLPKLSDLQYNNQFVTLMTINTKQTAESQLSFALRTFDLVNEFRKKNGLEDLKWASDLYNIGETILHSMEHSANMAELRCLVGHNGFYERWDRLKSRYIKIAEAISYNQFYNDPPKRAVENWTKSCQNYLLANYNVLATSCYKVPNGTWYFTLLLGLRKRN